MNLLCRAVHWINGTLLGRIVMGPLISSKRLVVGEVARLVRGDLSHVRYWVSHAVGVAAVLYWVVAVCGIPLWLYLLGPVWLGNGLVLVRSFTEHQPAVADDERTAIVEAGWFWSLLFLNNNLHVVHHDDPRLPWYAYRKIYRDQRAQILARNGSFFFRGYGEVFRRFAVRPRRSPEYVA
jgi:fatty acid desaturase